ncbi:MAG: hypothetical protein JJU13_00035 [Balneolaceae bacterium]|nr:hypothetical protein [Balneolaceae bacterium]
MNLREKSKKELEEKIDRLERLIATKGVGSDYLSRIERVQRDVNIALMLGGATLLLGATAWTIYKMRGE